MARGTQDWWTQHEDERSCLFANCSQEIGFIAVGFDENSVSRQAMPKLGVGS